MSKLTKILLVIVSLLGLLQALWFIALLYPLGVVSRFVKLTFLPIYWHQNIGLGLGVIVGLVFLYLLLWASFRPVSQPRLTIKTASGELAFSKKAVDNAISTAIVEQYAVRDVVVATQLRRKQHQVYATVHATPKSMTDLEGQAGAIKATVTETLKAVFNLPIKQVTVQLMPKTVEQQTNNKRVI